MCHPMDSLRTVSKLAALLRQPTSPRLRRSGGYGGLAGCWFLVEIQPSSLHNAGTSSSGGSRCETCRLPLRQGHYGGSGQGNAHTDTGLGLDFNGGNCLRVKCALRRCFTRQRHAHPGSSLFALVMVESVAKYGGDSGTVSIDDFKQRVTQP